MTEAQPQPMVSTAAGNWWALLLRGIAAVLFGLAALFWPGPTLFVLIFMYGAFVLVDGVFAIVAGIRAGRSQRRWLLMAEGVLSLLAGLIVLAWPGMSALLMLYVIAFWAILGGVLRIVEAISLRREIDNEWTLVLSGVLSIVLGVVLAVLPGVGLLSLAWMIGIFALGVGATFIVLAFKVRGHRASSRVS
ncbi:MAG: HdeD family acid-resistance protein [Rubrobacter sp.]